MNQPKRILICPLNWGLGHATRCIPIIHLLLKKNAEVIIAADGRPLELLKQEFPGLECICLQGYDIQYPDNGSMVWKMLFSIPKISLGIRKEHKTLKKIIIEKKIDVVISDNRFGLWSKDIKSIFITHQLMIKAPVAEKFLHRINLNYIKRYNECWIPDIEGPDNFSGDLAHKYKQPGNTFFIGILSRFNRPSDAKNETSEYDVMAIVSGPEPQRSIFEHLIVKQFQQNNLKALIVCGKTEKGQKKEIKGNIELIDHLGTDEMQKAILNSKIILARSGYSTIMDLAVLGKKAVFIPTPGQTEQEYLALMMMQKKMVYSQTQAEFDLDKALLELDNYKGLQSVGENNVLEKRIDQLLTN